MEMSQAPGDTTPPLRHPEDEDGPRTPARGPVLGYVVIGGLCVVGLGAIWFGIRPLASESTTTKTESTSKVVLEGPPSKQVVYAAALRIEDKHVGDGAIAKLGDTVRVHYIGRLSPTGLSFDASRSRGDEGFKFELGKGNVIKGWEQGILGMRVGGTRTLTIPPHLGYGERGAGDKVPPHSTLTFEVEMLDVLRDGKPVTESGATLNDPHHGAYTISEATMDVPGNGRLIAEIQTSQGAITCTLLDGKAPNTVANFIGLATGKRAFRDPVTNQWINRPAYDNTTFHRVINQFMIQGGDPKGDGTGEPGYVIRDENWEGAKHDRAGQLCMANRGPNTNGAQFFITDEKAAHLDGQYTIFGNCEPSVETVHKIAKVDVVHEKPVTPVKIESVTIRRVR